MIRTISLAFSALLLMSFANWGALAETKPAKSMPSCAEGCYKYCATNSSGPGMVNYCQSRCVQSCEARRAQGK